LEKEISLTSQKKGKYAEGKPGTISNSLQNKGKDFGFIKRRKRDTRRGSAVCLVSEEKAFTGLRGIFCEGGASSTSVKKRESLRIKKFSPAEQPMKVLGRHDGFLHYVQTCPGRENPLKKGGPIKEKNVADVAKL